MNMSASEEEFEFAVNEAAIYFDDGQLNISYGEGCTIGITMGPDVIALTKQVLATGDFWTAFLGALSNAVDKVKNDTAG